MKFGVFGGVFQGGKLWWKGRKWQIFLQANAYVSLGGGCYRLKLIFFWPFCVGGKESIFHGDMKLFCDAILPFYGIRKNINSSYEFSLFVYFFKKYEYLPKL